MTWYKPKTWFQKAPESREFVHVGADPRFPHVGLSVFSETRIDGPSLCVEGISVAQARVDLCGKVIDWSKLEPLQIESIRAGGKVKLPLETFKSLFR